jgi:hypothetical protein
MELKFTNCVMPCTTGYLWSFLIYTSKDTELYSILGHSWYQQDNSHCSRTGILLKQGQTVWMDNFYNSSSLAKTLKIIDERDRNGTLKLNWKNLLMKVKNTKLMKCEIIAQHSGPVSVTICSDKNNCHYDFHIPQSWHQDCYNWGKEVVKPISVLN